MNPIQLAKRNSARRSNTNNDKEYPMIAKKFMLCCAAVIVAGLAFAQVELKTYAGPDGYIEVQKLTCAQLAGTFQEDADYLAAWYSGWYNGLAKKHVMLVSRARSLQHEVIVYCKANPD